MTALDKHAQLRKELSNPSIASKDHLRKLALSLLDELETKEEQRANWFQMAQKLGGDLDAAEKRNAELERSETQLINERDDSESALNDAYKAVMGQAPEWSNWFSFADAIDEIELACGLWRNQTEDVIQLRQHVAELERYRTAFTEQHDKTDWVQHDKRFAVVRPLGKHRADVLREYIEHLEARTFKVEMPESFYPDGDIDAPLAVDELEVIAAIVEAGGKPIAFCKRCDREIDLTHRPDGSHYCHAPAAGIGVKGE